KEDTVFVVTYKRSALDKCKQPVGIRFFVSAAHTESDLHKAYESQKEQNGYTRVNCSAQSIESEHSLAIQDRAFRGNEDSLQLDKELERMKHNISLLPLTNYPSVQDLQKELAQRTLRFWAGHRNSRIRVIMARTWEPRIHSQGSYVETSSPFKPCHFDCKSDEQLYNDDWNDISASVLSRNKCLKERGISVNNKGESVP
ncbi:hypothetical protein Tco_0736567, partial [Tanacetum coccineum]